MVINRMRLVKWLESMPAVLSSDRIDAPPRGGPPLDAAFLNGSRWHKP